MDLGEFIVMPNHIHGVLIQHVAEPPVDTEVDVRKRTVNGGITGLKNPMLSDNISKVVRWYKGRCTYEIHKVQKKFEWQERFWENIILNDASFHRISNYIVQNPQSWELDTFYDP
jgi:REP element-mobilizing transposase RayT